MGEWIASGLLLPASRPRQLLHMHYALLHA